MFYSILYNLTVLLKCLLVDNEDHLDYEVMYRLYKTLYDQALSDQQILQLTLQSLHHPDIENTGFITKTEFQKVRYFCNI